MVFEKEMATTNISLYGQGNYENLTTYAFNGSSIGNTSGPQFDQILNLNLSVMLGAYPWAFVLIYLVPFVLLFVGTGSLKMPGIVGLITCLFAFVFLPAPVKLFAGILMVVSIAAIVWGVWKG